MASFVLVTEGQSFLSSHVIKQLQESGCQVRCSVGDLEAQAEAVKALQAVCPEAKWPLEAVQAAPGAQEGWEGAMTDVQCVFHCVKPEPEKPAATEGEAATQPATDATLTVLKAAVASKTVKRVVLCTSSLAVTGSPGAPSDKVYSEEDWADYDAATDPLVKSLVAAEKGAWDFVKELTDADKIELCVLNPTLALGPPLLEAQNSLVKTLLDRGVTGCPRVCYSVVDVRDIAAAAVKATQLDTVAGHRHILHGANLWMKDAATFLSEELKPQGFKIPTMNLPNWSLSIFGLFNKTVKTFQPMVGKQTEFDNKRMVEVLGVTPREVKDTVVDEARGLIDRGFIKMPKVKKAKEAKAEAAAEGAEAKAGDAEEAESDAKPKENGDVKDGDKEAKKEEAAEKTEGGEGDAPAATEAKSEEPAEAKTEEAAAPAEEKKEEEKAEEKKEEKVEEGAGDAAAAATTTEEAKSE